LPQQLSTLVSCIIDKESTNDITRLNVFTQEVFLHPTGTDIFNINGNDREWRNFCFLFYTAAVLSCRLDNFGPVSIAGGSELEIQQQQKS